MALNDRKGFWRSLGEDLRPVAFARLKDIAETAMLWLAATLAHKMQGYALTLGWSPEMMRLLDRVEEATVAASVIVLLVKFFFATLWGSAREFLGGGER